MKEQSTGLPDGRQEMGSEPRPKEAVHAAVKLQNEALQRNVWVKVHRFDGSYARQEPAALVKARVRGELSQGRFAPRKVRWKRAGQSTWIALASPFRVSGDLEIV